MAYDTTEAVAKFLSGFQMKITNRERDTVAPDYYVKYSLTLSKGGKDFSTTFVSDPRASGEPTVTQVFSALADDALTLRKYSTDEFVDKLYAQGVKPSAALRAYDSCKETNLWMQDELYLSGWEIEEISKTLTKYEDEVNTLVEKAASERAARYAYDHPKLPKGFVTIEQLQGDLDLGDLRDEVEDFDFDGDITEAFDEDLYYGDEGEEMAINDLMERDGLTEDEVREDFTDDEIFNHQMEMKAFDYEEEMRALAAFFNGEKSDMSDFVNPYGGNHILVSGSVGRWNGTSTGIAVYKDFDAATDCSPSRFGQGNVFADCEIQKVWDENGTLYLAGAHHDGRVSVEMRQLTDEGERLWGQLDYEDYLPLEGLTAMGKHYELGDENRFVHDLYNSPELCAAPRYVEQSFGCPSEEYEKEEGTLPHDFTTGKWRVHLIYPGERYGLDGCLTYELNAYSGAPAAAHRASYPLVEFYDTSQDAARFPGGQFVSRYYMTDLLEDNSIAVSIDTMLKNGNQFSLDGGIPAWTVEGDDLAKVNDFLKKSCMEFCGSLPGDEKDEDGYSLSGEAKDATASRNGLSRNQMGIEEKAAECKEAATVLANGNAL